MSYARTIPTPRLAIPKSARIRRRYRRGLGDDDTIMTQMQQACSNADYYNSPSGLMCRGMFPDGPPSPPQSDTAQCLASANAQQADSDAKVADLAANWNPPDTFDFGQVQGLVGSVMAVIRQAQALVDQSASSPNANQSDLKQATDDLTRHGALAVDFLQAVQSAKAAGATVLEAPNLKQWVLNSLNAASSAQVTAYVVSCTTPWWVGALAAFQTAFDAVWGVAKSIVGVAVTLADKVYKTAVGAFDLIQWIEQYGPYVAVGLGALWILTRDKSKRGTFAL